MEKQENQGKPFTEGELRQLPVFYRFLKKVPLASMKELQTPPVTDCLRLRSKAYPIAPDYKPLSNIMLREKNESQ